MINTHFLDTVLVPFSVVAEISVRVDVAYRHYKSTSVQLPGRIPSLVSMSQKRLRVQSSGSR